LGADGPWSDASKVRGGSHLGETDRLADRAIGRAGGFGATTGTVLTVSDPDAPTETDTPACYLHPKREALLRCSRCERPICGDDAIEAPVGYQCPRCAEGGAPVRRLVDAANAAPLTRGLVYVIGGLYLVTMAVPGIVATFGLRPILLAPGGPEVLAAAPWYTPSALALLIGEPWLLITSAFLHANLMHVGFNGLLLWQLGHMLEPVLGRARFASLYLAGLAGGGLGVVLLSWITTLAGVADIALVERVLGGNPFQATIGASGAVFGLMGAAMINLRARGINPWKTSIGTLVLLNLVITFVFSGISVGGHLGGLLGGALAGKLLLVGREEARRATIRTTALGVGMLVLAIVLARLTLSALGG
jgi:membrane associated rhomboid family serine protease